MSVTKVTKTAFKSRKGGTAPSRKHRFESFTQRIAKLKIDPVRRSRRVDLDVDDESVASSYFKASLDEWKELNVSGNFTDFVREVSLLSDSLPQILHFQDRIVSLLIKYIERRDTLSLEPLLSLVAHFAHDLGARFEKYYSRVVELVASLAANHPDVEAIEWSFNCLSWLFKYLSRLLVADLRPTYGLMAPLLGKESQKPFATRFAAEAMSFLVRKAGTAYRREKEPLEVIVNHAFEDLKRCRGTKSEALYQKGLMALFSESIKGINRGLYSNGETIFQCMLRSILHNDNQRNEAAEDVLCGVLVNIAHHTEAETFSPIANLVLHDITGPEANVTAHLGLLGRLLFILAGIRKGTRIEAWGPVMEAIRKLLSVTRPEDSSFNQDISDIIYTSALALQTAPIDMMMPHLRPILDQLSSPRLSDYFLSFCNYFSELGSERFRAFILPYFQKYIVKYWNKFEEQSIMSILTLSARGSLKKTGERVLSLWCPDAWQERILRVLENMTRLARDPNTNQHEPPVGIILCQGYLGLITCMQFDQANIDKICDVLLDLINSRGLRASTSDEPVAQFALGKGLETYVDVGGGIRGLDLSLWQDLCSSGARFAAIPAFLRGLLGYLESTSSRLSPSKGALEPLIDALVSNVSSPSHDLRALSLGILDSIYQMVHHSGSEDLSTAISIEATPANIETARSISMQIRKLASRYDSVVADPWLLRIVPRFCFGTLTIKLSSAWDEATLALQKIADTKEGEEEIAGICFRWLEESLEPGSEGPHTNPQDSHISALTDYDCSNLKSLDRRASQTQNDFENSKERLRSNFFTYNQPHSLMSAMARSQALRILSALPRIAERRSRNLVPMFLSWACFHDVDHQETEDRVDGDPTNGASNLNTSRWVRKDQKAMLGLFAKFGNPKALYKSAPVYAFLLSLLENGDLELQKSALEAILTWKSTHLSPYEERLRNLLDDARFSDEIPGFVQLSKDEEMLEHRMDLMPILLRILYGRILAHKGTASGRSGPEAKRRTVLKSLANFANEDLQTFISIALGPLKGLKMAHGFEHKEAVLDRAVMNTRRQLGVMNMIDDLVKELGNKLLEFTQDLLEATLYCVIKSSRVISKYNSDDSDESSEKLQISMQRSIRLVGFRCLNRLFSSCIQFDWVPYMPIIFDDLLNPRLEKLPIETAQSPSGIFQLIEKWSRYRETVFFLVNYNETVIIKIADCFNVLSAKEDVKLRALDIIRNLINLAEDGDLPEEIREEIRSKILRPRIDALLTRLSDVLSANPAKHLLENAAELVHRLAQYVNGSSDAQNLLQISVYLLKQPSRRVNPKTKGDLLQVLQKYLPLFHGEDVILIETIFNTVSSLFSFFKDRASRGILSQVLAVMAERDHDLREVSYLCVELNSFDATSIDEPDFDRRLAAYAKINDGKSHKFTARHWKPILHNMLYYIKDNEELSIRTSSCLILKLFVATARAQTNTEEREAFKDLLSSTLIPDIQRGVREPSELVRTEYLAILADIVRHFPDNPAVIGMDFLLVGGDEEASFFNNILHIQQHRRLRALRRLANEASQNHLESFSIDRFLIPLIEHFIFDKNDDDSSHALAAETVITVGALAEGLEWSQLRSLLRRYVEFFQSKAEPEKVSIRLLSTVIDAIAKAADVNGYVSETILPSDESIREPSGAKGDAQMDITSENTTALSSTLPTQERMAEDLTTHFLPPLTKFLNKKDDSTVSLRVPVAIAIVKLLKVLPSQDLSSRLPAVLTDVCHILRSRAQESRDITRKTLSEIASLLGSSCLGFIIKELRGALARGYQLHVLSFTIHSILVATTPQFEAGALDYCLPQLVDVVMDDIFGPTGQEKDAEDYVSQMKEVRSSKSYDSMELLAKTTTLRHLPDLIRPIQSLLQEKLNLKHVRKVDELLRRIGVGLLRNSAVQSRDLLVLCFEIIQEVHKANSKPSIPDREADYRTQRYLVNLKGARKGDGRGGTSSYDYKLTRFSLDILRTILHKHESLQTPSNLAGFIPLIGDALVQAHEEIQISALRLLTTIIRVPLPEIDQNVEIYIAEAVRLIKGSASTNTELAQAALKLVSAILRDRRNTKIEELKLNSRLAYLLDRLKADLEEPDRQGVTFNFLKAVLSRKVMLPEVYDILDTVAAIMVTNQTRGARDLARGVYFQFLMEYPQAKDRFAKQMSFLVRNLSYEHQEGRQSVLEVIHLLLSKVGENVVQEVVRTFMIPLVMVLVNDNNAECREMAGMLIKELFERADGEGMQKFMSLLRAWLNQDGQELLVRIALQTYGFYFDVDPKNGEKQKATVQARILQILLKKSSLEDRTSNWELPYYALQLLHKLSQLYPSQIFHLDARELWLAVESYLSYPHAWVKLSAVKLIGLYLADFARANAETGLDQVPLNGSGGMILDPSETLQLTSRSIGILNVYGVSEELATQSVRNLVFLGRYLGATGLKWTSMQMVEADDEPEQLEELEENENGVVEDTPEDDVIATDKSGLQRLFERLSTILRKEETSRRAQSLFPKTASLQLMAALCNHLPAETLTHCVQIILIPLHHLTDESITIPNSSDEVFNEAYKALRTTSQEIMALLQQKLGTSEYVTHYAKVQKVVKERREGRRIKRRIEAVTEPEKVQREKKKKGERMKVRRKEKSAHERGKRRGW
ncbi:MAG: U3 snoRNP protein [Sclerophora amabilis]|nr:MAG: U3 snoRNP protein [Sclerophora amabilis]